MMYFEAVNSAKKNYGNQTEKILKTLIQRFIGANPEIPYHPVIDFPQDTPYDDQGWCHVLDEQFSEIAVGEKILATTYWSAGNDRTGSLIFKVFGPTSIYVNEQLILQTNPGQENLRQEISISSKLHKGWNKLSIVTEKTPLGLGVQVRSSSPQWDPTHFFMRADYPLPVLGFSAKKYEGDLIEAPLSLKKEKLSSEHAQTYLVKVMVVANAQNFVYQGNGDLSINGELVKQNELTSVSRNVDWLDCVYTGTQLTNDLSTLVFENGSDAIWLYCGPIASAKNLSTTFTDLQVDLKGETIYWQAPFVGAKIRISRNAALFAHWTYWMGVTLYGFLEAGSYFSHKEWQEYALASVQQITEYDQYGLWDKEQYHYPLINTQFYWLDELDDCGSFGNLMLESLRYQNNPVAKKIAPRIADFMENQVLRQSDQAYYRRNDTMWIDDLYMSTPFLTRYWELSQDEKYLKEAIQQFRLFKKRFFMTDKNLMSHIYDTRFNKANCIPWSRGNGWVIFSLSELLNKLPADHPDREELTIFFNEIVQGLLAQQDDNGLWHQIIDDLDAYSESSCTAMFICAFSREIRNGYLAESLVQSARQAVNKAWNGLIEYCVDKDGNLYGVCRGSGFSFSRDYYRSLGWALNDAHGIGIVALAGVEYEKLNNFQ